MDREGVKALVVAAILAAAPAQVFGFVQQKGEDEFRLSERTLLETQSRKIREGFADGGIYAETPADERAQVVEALGRMAATMAGHTDVASLDADGRASLMNDQSLVNTILTRARADSRMVCRREQQVGSRMAKTHCLTVAERRRIREETQLLMWKNQLDLTNGPPEDDIQDML